jgi:hypothetical protein
MVQALATFTKKPTILTYWVVSVCMFFAGPSFAQTSAEYSLSARVEGTAAVLKLGWAHADLSTTTQEQPRLLCSEVAGVTWLPIPSNRLKARLGAEQPNRNWNPLSCLERQEWIGDKIQFIARKSTCIYFVTNLG